MENKEINNIDDYISLYTGLTKERLLAIRKIITTHAEDATEKISWGMPTFFLKKNLVHFAANKNHLGFYPGSSGVAKFIGRLGEYKTTKGSISFPYSKELPEDLIRDIVIFRVKENKKLK